MNPNPTRTRTRFLRLAGVVLGLCASVAAQLDATAASATPVTVAVTPTCSAGLPGVQDGLDGVLVSVHNPFTDPATTSETWGSAFNATTGAPSIGATRQTGPVPAGGMSVPYFLRTGHGHVVVTIAGQVHTATDSRASDTLVLEVDVPPCAEPEVVVDPTAPTTPATDPTTTTPDTAAPVPTDPTSPTSPVPADGPTSAVVEGELLPQQTTPTAAPSTPTDDVVLIGTATSITRLPSTGVGDVSATIVWVATAAVIVGLFLLALGASSWPTRPQ